MISINIKRFYTSWVIVIILTFVIITSCKKNNTNVDFTIDLTQPQFSALQGFGNSVVYNGIIIARTSSITTPYVAVSAYCTVDNQVLSFELSVPCFVCPEQHEFNEQGVEINTPGAPSLVAYNTEVINNFLRIYSQ